MNAKHLWLNQAPTAAMDKEYSELFTRGVIPCLKLELMSSRNATPTRWRRMLTGLDVLNFDPTNTADPPSRASKRKPSPKYELARHNLPHRRFL